MFKVQFFKAIYGCKGGLKKMGGKVEKLKLRKLRLTNKKD